MVKRPDLRLLDAMNSIEMMEPRMDTGVLRPDQKEFIFNPQTNMAPEELCWVMDEMLTLEVRQTRSSSPSFVLADETPRSLGTKESISLNRCFGVSTTYILIDWMGLTHPHSSAPSSRHTCWATASASTWHSRSCRRVICTTWRIAGWITTA